MVLLWREFILSCYDRTEERCVCNVLKTCGEHIETLSFPGYVAPRVAPSKLIKSFNYCGNVKHLSLPAEIKLRIEQLKEILQHMKCLKTYDVCMSTTQPQSSSSCNVFSLTAHLQEVTFHLNSGQCGWINWCAIKDWIVKGHNAKNLNIVMPVSYNHSKVANIHWVVQLWSEDWARRNSDIPADRTACIRVFCGCKVPLNLYQVPPVVQVHYGRTATLPFVKASTFGLLGFTDDSLLLTDFTTGGTTVHKAEFISDFIRPVVIDSLSNKNVTDLTFVTDFDFTLLPYSATIYSGHLEQLAAACPNLQRLNLQNNVHCLKSLKGLQMVANCCHNLQGLNVMHIPVREVECQMKLLQILNDIKLTHLAVELCILIPVDESKRYKKQLIGLLKKCIHLQALEAFCGYCEYCRSIGDEDLMSLSQFPSLQHCMLTHSPGVDTVVNTCMNLKYFVCFSDWELSLTPVHCLNLQQLYIARIREKRSAGHLHEHSIGTW